MTIEEAAQLLRIEQDALLKLAGSGVVPGRKLDQDWRFNRATLLGWLAGYQSGLAAAESPSKSSVNETLSLAASAPLSAGISRSIVGRGLAGDVQEVPVARESPTEAIGTAPKGRTASEVFLRDQRVLLSKNELAVDFGLAYARTDNLVLLNVESVPTLGLVESDTFGGTRVARYSLGDDTEIFAGTSYRNQSVSLAANGTDVSRASRGEFGDINVGLRHTALQEAASQPDVILSVEGGIPTDSGPYSLGGGVTFVKSFDPAVIFGSINYRHTFSRDRNDITRLLPRDRIDAQIGYAFALNDTIILNAGLSGSFNMATSFAQADLRQNETFNLLMGLTARVSPNLFVQPSVSYRLNGPGSGVIFSLNFPFTFDD